MSLGLKLIFALGLTFVWSCYNISISQGWDTLKGKNIALPVICHKNNFLPYLPTISKLGCTIDFNSSDIKEIMIIG